MRSWKSCCVFAALTCLGTLGCLALENRLLFQPTKGSLGSVPPPLEDVELRTADGSRIHARWCPRPQTEGALLYCPGNGGNLEHRAQLVYQLREQLGQNVLIFDYPGYGRSEGKPSEAGCYAAADAAYRWLVEERKIAPRRIVLYGESLGGGVAVELATRQEHRALVLARTFASVPDVAQAHFTSSVRPLVKNRFNSVARIGKCPRPVFIAQADHDRVIPLEQGEKLYAACTAPAEFYQLRGLDHNDPLPTEFFEKVRNFLRTRAPE